MVVILHDQATIGGMTEAFAVVTARARFIGRLAVAVEIPGFAVAFCGVVDADFACLLGVKDAFGKQGGLGGGCG